jgi:protein ImuA
VQLSSAQEDLVGMSHPGDSSPPRPWGARERELESPARRALLARLRHEIHRIERRPGRRDGIVASGLLAVDSLLPGGGFPRGAIAELRGGPASGKTAIVLSVLAALPGKELFAWVDARGELYPPAAAARGVELSRLLVVRPSLTAGGVAPPGSDPPWRAALWAAEALLASGAFAAVAIDVALPRVVAGAGAIARRLQAAAERGGAVGLWLSPLRQAGLRVPASVRLEVSAERGRIVARRAPEGPPGDERGSSASTNLAADLDLAATPGGRARGGGCAA